MSKKAAAAAPASEENIKVVIRCRPLSKDEVKNQNKRIVEMDRKSKEVRVRNPAGGPAEPPRVFTMDNVFDESLSQQVVYEETCRPIVANIIQGYNGTIFAYGQTGTGKTFTMEGVDKPPELKGMLPRAFDQVFDHIGVSTGAEFLVRASFLEIYNDNVLDLLAEGKEGLDLKEDPDKGVYVKDLRLVPVKTVAEINALAVLGRKSRKVGSTLMNRDSSRSHCLFCIMIEISEMGADGENHIRAGKLNMVDLAGSEKQTKTGAEGDRLKEAAKINLALSALGNVISALTSAKVGHVPYRDSKLTRLLQDSLGGNTKTVMIANLGPADYNYDETIGTLRFATRAKSIKNKPKINEDPKDAMLRQFQDEIAQLKAMLAAEEAIAAGLPPPAGYDAALAARMNAGGSGPRGLVPLGRPKAPPVVVKKEVIKTVVVGVAPEEVDRARLEAEQMKRSLEEKQRAKEEELRQVKELLDSKKSEIASEVAATEEEIAKKRSDRLAMRSRLHEMENAIMHSTAQIDEAKRHEISIRQKQMEIERQRLEAEQAAEATRAIEDEASFLATRYSDLGQELANKSSKLDRLTGKYAEIKQEAEDIQAENQREREQLLETIRELTRHIQLKDFILDNFVPREETEKVENRAYWDEEQDAWLLHPTDYRHLNLAIRRPGSAKAQLRRPTSDFALAHAMQAGQGGLDGGPRFRAENILELALDMPERTTQDYGAEAPAHAGQGQFDSANHELQLHLQQQAAAQAQAANANRGMQAYMQMGADPMMQQQYRR